MSESSTLLMKLCTENVFRDNVFHILGLRTTATSRQIRRRKEDIEAAHDLGKEAWKNEFKHLLSNRNIPTYEEAIEAFTHIEDPEFRIVSEFFWVWPIAAG